MPRKTDEERLLDIDRKRNALIEKVKQKKIKFRREIADDLLKSCEKVAGVSFDSQNLDKLQEIKDRIATAPTPTPDNSEEIEQLKSEIETLKERNNNLQLGGKLVAIISDQIGREITEDDLPAIKKFLAKQDDRGRWFSNALS